VGPLRILSYNVRYFGHATRGIASTRKAMCRIATAIAALDPLPDIVCLQEVETDSLRSTLAHPRTGGKKETQLERLMAMLDDALAASGHTDGYEPYYFPAHAYRVGRKTRIYTTGLSILTRKGLVVHHHNAQKPADITFRRTHLVRRLKQTRICAHVRLRLPGGQVIDVFNTHLSLPTTLSGAFWTGAARMGYGPNQLREAQNLARFVEAERVSDRFFIAGDFNALPGSPVYRYLTEDRGYQDPFARLFNMSEEDLRRWPTAGFLRMRMHIDHVFSGGALRWVDFDDTRVFGDKTGRFHGLSDHVPIIGRLAVAQTKRASVGPKNASVRPPPR
jgi:endonuclease/exonuclease/phosphatase family metal-dependent hydrolase